MGVYESLGVKRVINAWGPMTRIGSARVLALDHQAVARGWEEDVALVIAALQDFPGVGAVRDEALYSEGIPVARITVDPQVAGRSAAEVAAALADGDPAVRVTRIRDWLSINPQFLEAGEVHQITERLTQVLRA